MDFLAIPSKQPSNHFEYQFSFPPWQKPKGLVAYADVSGLPSFVLNCLPLTCHRMQFKPAGYRALAEDSDSNTSDDESDLTGSDLEIDPSAPTGDTVIETDA